MMVNLKIIIITMTSNTVATSETAVNSGDCDDASAVGGTLLYYYLSWRPAVSYRAAWELNLKPS